MPTYWNSVGKVKNTKLYNVATPYLLHVALPTFTGETTATHVQLSQASSNHVIEH